MRRERPIYNSFSEVPYQGWKSREANAAARHAAEVARRSDPAFQAAAAARRSIMEEGRLSRVLHDAEEKLAKLQSNLTAAKARTGRLDDLGFATGDVPADLIKVKAQIVGLPPLIDRAAREVTAAHEALAAHRVAMAGANAVPAPETVVPEAEPVEETARGRGRARKAA